MKKEYDEIDGYNSDKKNSIALDHMLTCELDRMDDLTVVVGYQNVGLTDLELEFPWQTE